MTKEALRKLIRVAHADEPADLVIKNARVLNVFTGDILEGDIAVSGGDIAGVGRYEGKTEVDAHGAYALPGFIDSHIHIESSYVSPEELGRLLLPHGGTTIMADPHEIVNVLGITGLDYMMRAAKRTKMDIRFMLPSCVPATPFEDAGAVVDAKAMEEPIQRDLISGLGEFMNCPGVYRTDEAVLDKLMVAKNAGKLIDGHSPGITGYDLTAYAAARIQGDHECDGVEAMKERLNLGIYVLLRHGSACQDLEKLIPGITPENARRCLLCSDDRQPKTILSEGHLDYHLRVLVKHGIDPLTAVRMATLNAAECFRLYDRGAIAPGYVANIVLVEDLADFAVQKVFMHGELTAQDGKYLPEITREDITPVAASVHLEGFTKEKFRMHLKSSRVHTIEIQPGGVVTKKSVDDITVKDGEFVWDPQVDITKVSVLERHHNTGKAGNGFLKGYGIKHGAVALSVAHDSHNVIVTGVNDDEMAFAVKALEEQGGGIVLVREGRVVSAMPMPIAGLMSNQSGEWVNEKLTEIHDKAYEELGIHGEVEPVMTLCFMSLPVIPEIKLTDRGLFDFASFDFIPVEA